MTKDSETLDVRLAADRTFATIRVDSVDVVTPRNRGSRQFKANVRSIADNGLYKPILVNAREQSRTGRYQLICGEGRLRAHQELKRDTIKAEIVKVDRATAHLMTLGENMTKCPPEVIEYAYALLEMRNQGASMEELQRVTGYCHQYVRGYITLAEQGEERLIKGVEHGIFPLDFAMQVAESPESGIQHILMDAYDRKMITSSHVDAVRKILMERTRQGSTLKGRARKDPSRESYSVDDLKKDISRLTREKEKFVQEAESRETRLILLAETLRKWRAIPDFAALLRKHGFDKIPQLTGPYAL